MSSLKDRLNQDIKKSLLSGDKTRAEILRNVKAAVLNEEVALGVREAGLDDEQFQKVFAKEAKKRQESAELFRQGGREEQAAKELAEKAVIEEYLPKQLGEDELIAIVDEVIASLGDGAQMGPVIGAVKAKVGTAADGARVAAIVKSKLG